LHEDLVAITQFDHPRQQDICRVLFFERSTLSCDLERMQVKGWLEVMPGEDAKCVARPRAQKRDDHPNGWPCWWMRTFQV
jgi:hypothetical protein